MTKKAYKFRCYPNNPQTTDLDKTFGCSRFVNNHILNLSIETYKTTGKGLSDNDRLKLIPQLKAEFSWLNEPSSIALQQSIRHLNTAFTRFFNKKSHYPQFKKKTNRNSFTITGAKSIHFDNQGNFYLPKMKEPLKIKMSREFDRKAVSSVTVSKEPSGRYFISFLVEENIPKLPQAKNKKIAADMGLKTTAVTFNGKEYIKWDLFSEANNLEKIIEGINRKHREMSRKVLGSGNRNKCRIKLAKLYERKKNIIEDCYNKLSYKMIVENQEIIIEDLNIAGMKKNRKLANSIHQVAWGKLFEQLEYKSMWYGRELFAVDRYYASSKECSHCHIVNKSLTLSDRKWQCGICKVWHDRDENAATNLYHTENIKLVTKVSEGILPKEKDTNKKALKIP